VQEGKTRLSGDRVPQKGTQLLVADEVDELVGVRERVP